MALVQGQPYGVLLMGVEPLYLMGVLVAFIFHIPISIKNTMSLTRQMSILKQRSTNQVVYRCRRDHRNSIIVYYMLTIGDNMITDAFSL